MSTRVVLVDDHTLVRRGICLLLREIPGVEVCGEAGDGDEGLRLVRELQPDVLLTDIAMDGPSGLTLAAQVTREFPDVKVMILSMHSDEEYVIEALRLGVAGYLLKDSAAGEVENAIRTVDHGETYLSPRVSRQVIDSYVGRTRGEDAARQMLTPRQTEVLRLVAEGHNTKEIAGILGISVKTAQTHRTQLQKRLHIHDVAGLVRYAMRLGLVPHGS